MHQNARVTVETSTIPKEKSTTTRVFPKKLESMTLTHKDTLKPI